MGRAFVVGLLLLFLTACGVGSTAESEIPGAAEEALAPETAPAAEPAAESASSTDKVAYDTSSLETAQQIQAQQDRLVIKTATLQLEVARVDEAEAQVRQLITSMDGFVLSSQTYGEGDERFANITIKVPANRFDETIARLSSLALKVDSQEVKGEDVTDEYVDLESRLRHLQAVEARLLEFLEQAETVEDALRVNQQLMDIQGQIEQTRGRINYLEQSAAMSTITVSLHARTVVAIVPEAGWSLVATARWALRSLLEFGQRVASILIVFGIWAPVWLPALVGGLWLWRRARRAPVGTA
jgi:hypothetical protein